MSTPSPEELQKAFESIQRHDLVINTIICAKCGCIFKINNVSEPCEHIIKMFEDWADIKGWDRF